MFQCILTRWVHCLCKPIRLTGKELIHFQGVCDGFNCCFSKSGKNELFLHFLPNWNYPLPNSQGWKGVCVGVCVGGCGWWQGGWEETCSVSHTILAFWDKSTSTKEKLISILKVLLRRTPSEFLQLPFFQNTYCPSPCRHSSSRVWLLLFPSFLSLAFVFATQLWEHSRPRFFGEC